MLVVGGGSWWLWKLVNVCRCQFHSVSPCCIRRIQREAHEAFDVIPAGNLSEVRCRAWTILHCARAVERWHTDHDTVLMQRAAADPLVQAAGGSAPLEVPVDGRNPPVADANAPNEENGGWFQFSTLQ